MQPSTDKGIPKLSAAGPSFKNIQLARVEILLLLVVLVFGLLMILLIPPGAGYDEEDHLVRVWELSSFSFIPGQLSAQELRYPTVFRDFAYRQQGSEGVIDPEFWQSYRQAPLYDRGFVRREIDTKSVYSPALLLPQALTMGIFGRLADLPTLPVFYLTRFANLLSYLVLSWLAVRLIPVGKRLLLVLAASPMALFQAATLTSDAISNGIGFLFVAGILWIARRNEIGGRELTSLVFLFALLFLAKLNLIPLLLLFLLLPPSRFLSRRHYTFLLGIIFVLFLIEVVGWNWIASRNFNSLLLAESNPKAQLLFMLGYPLSFLLTVIRDATTNGWIYFQGWINGYGYYYWTPPFMVSLFFLLSLVSAVLMSSRSEQVNRRTRLIFLLVFLAGYLATIASLYISYSPVGSEQVYGVQGRYFIPLAFVLFLALTSLSWKVPSLPAAVVAFFLLIALSVNLLGLYLSFHVECGSTFYQTGLCYRPLFKDLPSDVLASAPVSDGIVLTQEFQVACNGLSEVRVLLAPSSQEDRGITRFVLREGSSEQPLLDQSIANGPIREETWYSLRFEANWYSAEKLYALEILGTNPSPSHGLQFFYTPQSEFDLGDFSENGELLEEDLVLQYGCATGLRKLWLIGGP